MPVDTKFTFKENEIKKKRILFGRQMMMINTRKLTNLSCILQTEYP